MKVLMVAGASIAIVWFRQNLIRHLQSLGCEVSVIACDDINREKIEKLGVKFYCAGSDNVDTSIISNLKYIKQIKKIIKQINPDKIMTFQIKANTFAILGAKLLGYKDITAFVEGLGNSYNSTGLKGKFINFVANVMYKTAFYKIPTVVFLNKENKDLFINKKLVKKEQCFLINGIGVDIDKFALAEIPPTDTVKFVMVARLEERKGVIEYCEAAKSIINSGYNASFEYYGACDHGFNPMAEYKGFVNYKGYTDEIVEAYKNNHIMVLPTYYNEGLPKSIMEAMSVGRPIITTNSPGCNKTVVEGKNGFFVKGKSVDDLVDKMLFFINNKNNIKDMGLYSRDIAVKQFDCNVIDKQIIDKVGL